jgi:FMN reductase
MKIILIQGSLRPGSRTAVVTQLARNILDKNGIENELLDLRDYNLPFCDGRPTQEYGEPVQTIYKKLEEADGYIIASPVYAYTYSGVVKNFIDIFGKTMINKFSGVIYNAGGSNSYLASGELVKIMAFDYKHTVVQPTVYTYKMHFGENGIISDYVENKLNQMLNSLITALRNQMQEKMYV